MHHLDGEEEDHAQMIWGCCTQQGEPFGAGWREQWIIFKHLL